MIGKASQFSVDMLKVFDVLPAPRGRRREKKKYLDCVCAFDIETSTNKALQINYMYIWQFQIDDYFTIIGRRWSEFTDMMQKISDYLEDTTLVVYVHNLSYQ